MAFVLVLGARYGNIPMEIMSKIIIFSGGTSEGCGWGQSRESPGGLFAGK